MYSRLAEISDIVYGKSPADVLDPEGPVPIIGTGGEYGRASRPMFNAGVVVPRKGSLGNPQLVLVPFWPTDTTFAVLPMSEIDTRWLYYCLLNYDLEKLNEATGVPSISRDWLSKIRFFNPGPARQSKIGDILQAIDRAIEKTGAMIDKYQQIKAGLMHDLFTRGIGPDGQLRPPREQASELYQKTPIGWMPREWDYKLLDHLAVRGSGHTPSKSYPEYWNGGVKWLSLSDSPNLDKLYISDTEHEISEEGLRNSSAVMHPAGVVVLSRDAGIGKSAISTSPMAVSQHFMCWKCGEKLNNHFLYYWLQYNKRSFENIAMGSTILTIGLQYFKRLRIGRPTNISEQDAIADALKRLDDKLAALEKDLNKKLEQKSGLMQDLLTGKVTVQVEPEDQPEAAHV